jgi:hypothetical protein
MPPSLIELSCTRSTHLFAILVIQPSTNGTGCAGRGGDDDIRSAHAAPTISDRPPASSEHHNARLNP